jgi:predicted Zn-dependent protease
MSVPSFGRRRWLAAGCAHCLALGGFAARAQAPERLPQGPMPGGPGWVVPDRFARPDLASDEGGLWAMMDREETRLRRSPSVIRDPELRAYLQGIACRLAGTHCPDVRVYPIRTPIFNANMAPNGMMQIWSGLLLRVENEAQLAAVLGHELGHYMRRHTLEQLRDARARSAFATFISVFGLAGMAVQLATLAGSFAFSRDQEREADAIGLRLMTDAGYDPREAAEIWENLRAELAAAPDGRPNPMTATHPGIEERSATLARLAEGATGGSLGEAEYAKALAPFQFELLEDEVRRAQHGETLVLLDRLLKRAPERADLFYFRGETRRLRAKEGDLDAALADLRQAVALGREPPQAHRSLGYVLRLKEQPTEAQAEFARYIELLPSAPDAALIRSYLPEGKT